MSKFVTKKSGYRFNDKGEYVKVFVYRESDSFDWYLVNDWHPFAPEREYTDVYKFYDGENHGELFFSDFYMIGMQDMFLIQTENGEYKEIYKYTKEQETTISCYKN